eukprot:106933-Prymnesium_polylepis.1
MMARLPRAQQRAGGSELLMARLPREWSAPEGGREWSAPCMRACVERRRPISSCGTPPSGTHQAAHVKERTR